MEIHGLILSGAVRAQFPLDSGDVLAQGFAFGRDVHGAVSAAFQIQVRAQMSPYQRQGMFCNIAHNIGNEGTGSHIAIGGDIEDGLSEHAAVGSFRRHLKMRQS